MEAAKAQNWAVEPQEMKITLQNVSALMDKSSGSSVYKS
jgi:hypothetical protein